MDNDLFCFGVNLVDDPIVSNSQAIKPFGTGYPDGLAGKRV